MCGIRTQLLTEQMITNDHNLFSSLAQIIPINIFYSREGSHTRRSESRRNFLVFGMLNVIIPSRKWSRA